MPILYSNKKNLNIMNDNINKITKEHFDAMKRHHKLMDYTENDINELVTLVRLYVDHRQASCLTCHNNLREAKNKLNGFYSTYKDQIEQKLNATQIKPLSEIQIAQEQVIEYKENSEKKKRGRKPKTE